MQYKYRSWYLITIKSRVLKVGVHKFDRYHSKELFLTLKPTKTVIRERRVSKTTPQSGVLGYG